MFNIAPYQFLEWERESFCCGDYVLLVLRDYLSITLPPVHFQGSLRHAASTLSSYPYREKFKPLDKPQPYCVIEMQQFSSPDHVGVVVEVDGKLMVTHCVIGSGVLLSTFSEIREQYKIVGFYEYCSSI